MRNGFTLATHRTGRGYIWAWRVTTARLGQLPRKLYYRHGLRPQYQTMLGALAGAVWASLVYQRLVLPVPYKCPDCGDPGCS